MGIPLAGEAQEGHHSGMPRGFCPEYNGKEACCLRPIQPGPEGQNATNRLPSPGRQGVAIRSRNGDTF